MIKIKNAHVSGLEDAIRGMRNPLESWNKSDSFKRDDALYEPTANFDNRVVVGPNDLNLMKALNKAGSDERKFMRFINVTFDLTAPFYWWKQFDTYKIGTVANSCSTMHKMGAKKFDLEDFSIEHLSPSSIKALQGVINQLNYNREEFLRTGEKDFWWQMIQLLPTSYNQKRTVQLNYEVLERMYFARRNHKLDEWHQFCDFILTLPYMKELIESC